MSSSLTLKDKPSQKLRSQNSISGAAKAFLSENTKRTIWKSLLIGILPLLVIIMYQTVTFYQNQPNASTIIDYRDLSFSFLFAIGFIVSRHLFCSASLSGPFFKLAVGLVDQNKWPDKKILHKRHQRLAYVFFKFSYFILWVPFSYSLLVSKDFLPPVLGGTGSLPKVWNGFPFEPLHQDIILYYQIAIGYAIHSLVYEYIAGQHRVNFYEMTLHHVMTIFLLLFSWANGAAKFGTLIQFLHDIPDLFAYFAKIGADMRIGNLKYFPFVLLLLFWGYFRLYIFPFYILDSVWSIPVFIPGYYPMAGFLVILQIMHFYWYFMFLQMAVTAIKGGADHDITDQEAILEKLEEQDITHSKKHI